MPKFLQDDLKLFNGIVSDLFPKIRDVPVDYGDLELSIRNTTLNKGLEDVEGKLYTQVWLSVVIELWHVVFLLA